mmetsp:Transcript_2775/g.6230  ORF Transcript_2775/g.6230 Transcript_2775/m.6230 type:complete len:282 (-) Transcript_2775:129-974(-)
MSGSSSSRSMGFSHLGFVGAALYAIRRAGKAAAAEPPDYLRCPITQELFRDPVILSQTGYTFDRGAIERWLSTKSPPTDPITNVELHTTETVPNWSLRDAANEWCGANGVKPLDNPECSTRKLAGGGNARNNPAPRGSGPGGGGGGGGGTGVGGAVSRIIAGVSELASSATNGFARAAMERLGMSPSMAAHVFSFGVLALACLAFSLAIMIAEGVLSGIGASALASRVGAALAGPAQSIAWWAGIFSIVWFAQGGHVDMVRADTERRNIRDGRRRVVRELN